MPKVDWDNERNPATQKEIMMLGKTLGVDTGQFQEEDTGSQGAYDWKKLFDAVERAGSENYDFRRSTEAAQLAGAKNVPTDFGSAEDVYNVHKWMESQHRGGGNYSSPQDRANITNYWVQEAYDSLADRFDDLPSTPIDDVIPIEEEVAASAEPYTPSQELTVANEIVNDRETGILDGSYSANVFAKQPDEEEAQTLAQSMANKFTLKLGGAMYQDPKNIERAEAALAYPFSPSLEGYIS